MTRYFSIKKEVFTNCLNDNWSFRMVNYTYLSNYILNVDLNAILCKENDNINEKYTRVMSQTSYALIYSMPLKLVQ